MTDPVYLATGSGVWDCRVYHTDADCRALRRANGQREKALANVPDDRRECRICSGEARTAPKPATCRSCGAEKDADGVCPFCAACDDVGVTNGRHKWHRRARRSD